MEKNYSSHNEARGYKGQVAEVPKVLTSDEEQRIEAGIETVVCRRACI